MTIAPSGTIPAPANEQPAEQAEDCSVFAPGAAALDQVFDEERAGMTIAAMSSVPVTSLF